MQNKFLLSAKIATCLSIASSAYADIIFMNLHESPDELKAVQKVAASRGEKVWVISPQNKDDSFRAPLDQQIQKLEKEARDALTLSSTLNSKKTQLENQYYLLSKEKPWYQKVWDGVFHGEYAKMAELKLSIDKTQKQIDAAYQSYADKSAESSRISQIRNSMKKDLKDTLDKIQKSGKGLSTLIVSGHHVGERYWGHDSLQIYENDIREVLKQYPKATQHFYSFLGWGCHTGELDDIQAWKEAFPQLKVIIGFAGSGPLAGTQADHNALEDALKKETSLMVAQDLKVAQRNLTSLKDANVTYLAGLVNQCYVGTAITNIKPMQIGDSSFQDCNARKESLLKSLETYQKYFYGEGAGFEDVPDAESQNTPLRVFYNNVETYRNCYTLFGVTDLPSVDQIVGLIHAKIIQKNFEAFYGVSLGKTRKEVMNNGNKISDRSIRDAGRKIVGAFECVPAAWITEEPTPGKKPVAPDARCLAR